MKKITKLIVTVGILSGIWVMGRVIPEEYMKSMVENAGVMGPIGIVILALTTNIFAPISGGPVMLAGYYAYGKDVVWLIALAGYISFAINFWIARKLGTPIVEKLVGKNNLDRINQFLMGKNEIFLFFSRMFHGGLHDFVSYAAGLTDMPFKKYMSICTLGIIPGTLIWYLLVSGVNNPESFLMVTMIVSGVLATIFTLGMLISTHNENSKN